MNTSIQSLSHPIAPLKNPLSTENFDLSSYGSKGVGLMLMASLGMPVPLGFIIPMGYGEGLLRENGGVFPESLPADLAQALGDLEEKTGHALGKAENPLFLSVRSAGALSMPGMMDTFLNMGLTPDTCPALAHRLGWSREETHVFYQKQRENWEKAFKESEERMALSHHHDKGPLPHGPHHQIWRAIQGVWNSWNSPRAVAYRRYHHLPDTGGTAVIIQSMVFGNATGFSGTGVLFTRRPDTGTQELFGEFLPHCQGEALVSGAQTPLPLDALEGSNPEIFQHLSTYAKALERAQNDMQDIEFTIENHHLWLLQTRSGKRTATAAFRIAHDRLMAGETTREACLQGMDPMAMDALLYPTLAQDHALPLMSQGLPTSPGAAIGALTLHGTEVTSNSILVCSETSAEDIPAMLMARGVVTLRGGMTSHAAVIMRSIGKPCLSALENARITPEGLYVQDQLFPQGTTVTMDGTTGHLFHGEGTIQTPSFSEETQRVLSWADEARTLDVYANADTPQDIARALAWGADGIGLCRSEHMMLERDQLRLMQQFILAPTPSMGKEALEHLEVLHQRDLAVLLRKARGKSFVLRLLDPPLHEFLPTSKEEKNLLADSWGLSPSALEALVVQRHEINPMMGQRGCRLGLAFPSLYAMQMRALLHAMDQLGMEGLDTSCGIMIPFVSHAGELESLKNLYESLNPGTRSIHFGVMIETPRAALLAHELAPMVDFMSFGTNDLTQLTWGLSRDDGAPITLTHRPLGIGDPFSIWDASGVGQLVKMACEGARRTNPHIALSVCGEHAACPKSIPFFHDLGISLSCSPFALPRVRLAAAKAALQGRSVPLP